MKLKNKNIRRSNPDKSEKTNIDGQASKIPNTNNHPVDTANDQKNSVSSSTANHNKINKSNIILPFKKNVPWYKNPIIITVLILFVFSIGLQIYNINNANKLDYGTIIEIIKKEEYSKVEVHPEKVVITKNDNEKIEGNIPNTITFFEDLRNANIDPTQKNIYAVPASEFNLFSIISLISTLAIVGFVIYIIYSARNISSSAASLPFGESKAKLFTAKMQDVKFDDIKGADEAVNEVREIVEFLKNPKKFIKMGARIPKGVLLVGAPGTGKTLLARAIAGEAGVPFFFTSGSEFEEMLVGAGASRVRDLFTKAKKIAPSIIFIDEIDSIAKKRGTIIHSGNTDQTLNQILVEMDGFQKDTNVIVIAATNRPDVLDPAILRPGRFDRRIVLDLPDMNGRLEILKIYAKNKPLSPEIDLETLAKRTIGYSGADLENVLNEAAIIAAKHDRQTIEKEDIEEAINKVILGPARNRTKSEKYKRIVAYHEAGHALVSFYLPEADKVHRVSIIPRGYSGGATIYIPDEESYELRTIEKFEADLASLYGGREAERIVFNTFTTGASSDIKRATQIASDMVKKYGMSSLGYVEYSHDDIGHLTYSQETAKKIDEEIAKILEKARKTAEEIIIKNREKLDKIAQTLLEKEVIEQEEFVELMNS